MKTRQMFGTVAVALALFVASCSSGSSNSTGAGGSGGQSSQTANTNSGGTGWRVQQQQERWEQQRRPGQLIQQQGQRRGTNECQQ